MGDIQVIWPLAHYYLAIAYEESGDTDEAVHYYAAFLETWKDGDRNLKAIVDATKRLAQLTESFAEGKHLIASAISSQ